jgi:hypothetical protein
LRGLRSIERQLFEHGQNRSLLTGYPELAHGVKPGALLCKRRKRIGREKRLN